MSAGSKLNTVSQQKENNISRKAYNSTFAYSYTTISRPQSPHILNVQLWIDNAHVFSGCMMNPVAHKGLDILSTLVSDCEHCLLLVNCIVGGVFNEAAWRKIYFSRCFFTNIGMESILTQRNSTEKYLFYCYANFVAIRLLLTKKKLREFNSNVIGYKITLLFQVKVHTVYFKTVQVLSIFSLRHDLK